MRKIFYTVSDGGDGSYSTWFFDSQECIDLLEERNPDVWACGEGGGFFYASDIQGIHIYDMEQVLLSLEAEE